ncbi:MAG TPA: GNAT family N-acetyltransferase [Steroidobacteraceae bacterium]
MNAPHFIRIAGRADVELVAPLFDAYRQFYGRACDLSTATRFLADRLRGDESVVLVASNVSGDALGFAQLFPSFSSVRATRIYVLNDLFVVPQARRQGLGRELLVEAAEIARSRGASRLRLSTAVTNVPAQRLYESLGWIRDNEFCEYNLGL